MENSDSPRPLIGLSSATANELNTSDECSFWLSPDVIVNPFDIVELEQVARGAQAAHLASSPL